jgi:hypothetical protein
LAISELFTKSQIKNFEYSSSGSAIEKRSTETDKTHFLFVPPLRRA